MAKRLAWFSLLMLLALPLRVAAGPRQVLLLHSFEREFAPFDAFAGNFRTELSKNSPVPVDFYEVSLQLARSNEKPPEGPILDYMHAMFANRRLDLVVPIGGPAVQFAQKNRQELFPSTPMLIAAVDQRLVNMAALRPNDAVVSVLTDPSLVIDTILQILPQTTNVDVLIGSSQLETFWHDELIREFQRFKGRLTFDYLNELSFGEILKRSATLPPNSVIYFQLLAVDAKGVSHAEARVLRDLHAVANAPIFGDQGYQLGQGVVGGPLLAFDDLSQNTAGVALRIMDGESPEHLRLAPQPPGPQIFDWRELRHWGISEDRLPPGSIVQFREMTVWERYKWQIIAALSVCLLEALLILALIANLIKRRRAERSLSESTNRLGAILSTAAEGILTFNDRGIIESVNAAAGNIFGYTAGEMLGRNVSMVLPALFGMAREESVPNDGQTISPDFRGTVREASGRRKDGSMFPIDLAMSEVVLADRRILTGFVRDITERKQAEEGLREREQRLRLALNASGAGTWMRDFRTDRDDRDDRYRELYGFTAGEPVSSEVWLSRVHEEDRRQVLDLWDQILHMKTQDTFDTTFRIVRPDGTVSWIQSLGQALRDAHGEVMQLIGLELDVTERRRAEERDRTLQLLLETAPQGILSVDARGVIVTANRTLEKMFGWATGELIGQSVDHLVPPAIKDQHAAHRAAYFKTPQPRWMAGSDLLGQRKDGSTFPIEIILNHVTNADGGHAIAFVTDISARRRDQAALQRSHAELERRTLQLRRLASQLTVAEQSARKQLASTLHDGLQQLLFTAWITLDQVEKGNFQDDQVRLLLRVRANVKEAMEAARTLSGNLFPPVLHIGGLPAGLEWLAKRTKEQYSVVVSVTADRRANPEASDVRILLFEAVRELLFNAVKHAHVDRVDVKLALGPNDTIDIQVSDEGVGFDPTVTLHHKDQHQAGLGLFSIQERLALLGGHLHIESAPGKGAQFSITVPLTGVPDLTTGGAGARRHDTGGRLIFDSASGTLKSLRILIADDHAVARVGLRELFSQRPALRVVGEAADGVEAISQAMALQPDVIVMDVSMPQMNGSEATREIHRALPNIQIVGLSTHDDENSERLMREAGAEAYFTKNEGADRLLDYLLCMTGKGNGATIDLSTRSG